MKLVFALPEGVWYRVISLSGDTGMRVYTLRQLEIDFSTPVPLSEGGPTEPPPEESERFTKGGDLCPVQDGV